jgi:hypothetical protein
MIHIVFNYELLRQGRKTTEIKITVTNKGALDRLRIAQENERLLDEKEGIDYAQTRIDFNK